eukprot:UN01084
MTTGQDSTHPQPVQAAPPCKFDGRHRRKFRAVCCCITFLLLVNALLLMHTAHSVGGIAWFMTNGSYTYKDTTYLFVPGGANTLCNDLCVDMCVYNNVCELNSCLNVCNQQLIEDGNNDDFQQLPESEQPMLIDQFMDEMETLEFDPYVVEEDPDVSSDNGQEILNGMKDEIEAVSVKLRTLKAEYIAKCDEDPNVFGCNFVKVTINKYIETLKQLITQYDTYAESAQIDIKVSVW